VVSPASARLRLSPARAIPHVVSFLRVGGYIACYSADDFMRDLLTWSWALWARSRPFAKWTLAFFLCLGCILAAAGLREETPETFVVGAGSLLVFLILGPAMLLRDLREHGRQEPATPLGAERYLRVVDGAIGRLRPPEIWPGEMLLFSCAFVAIAIFVGYKWSMGVPFFLAIAVMCLWAHIHPDWIDGNKIPPSIPGILGVVCLLTSAVAYGEATLLATLVQSGTIKDRFIDIQRGKSDHEFKAVHVVLNNGEHVTVRSGSLWDLMADGYTKPATLERTRLLHAPTMLTVDGKKYDVRFTHRAALRDVVDLALIGIGLVGVGVVLCFWRRVSPSLPQQT
jgi:hypothetical protein